MKKYKNPVLLFLIILFAFFLRIYNINALPATLNPDEAALGYNAYAILKTGADEHGVTLPTALKSFGDWKLPIYSYLDTVPLALIGVSKLSVRLPSVIAGILAVGLIYFISLKLFKNNKIALLSSFFLAINPWSIFFSRGAYEVNVATTIFLGGLVSILLFFEKKKIHFLFLSFFLFGLTMFTQHNYILFVPLFTFCILVLQRKKYSLDRNFFLAMAFFIILLTSSYISLSQGGGQKTSNLNIFNDKAVIYNRAEKLRGDESDKIKILEIVFYNKYSAGLYQSSLNYLNAYSPNLLFDKGGERLVHNIGEIGYFYVLDAMLFIIGLFFLAWNRDKKALLFILPWLILAPLPSAITRENTGTRLFTIVPPMILVISYGFYHVINYAQEKRTQVVIAACSTILVVISFVYFINYYFIHFNTQRIRFWRYGYEQVVKVSQKYPDHSIVMRGPENFPYIYFLLLNKYDPQKFRREVTYYPVTSEGFYYVKSFGRYSFPETVDYSKTKPKTIYFDDINLKGENQIYLPNGDPIIGYDIKN